MTTLVMGSSPKPIKFPLMLGNGFAISIAVFGEMSSGKSTFVNALFGDCLAQVGHDRTTMGIHRFYEADDRKGNQDILGESIAANNQEKGKFTKAKERYFGRDKDEHALLRGWRMFVAVCSDFEYDFGDSISSHPVKPSALVKRQETYDNVFNVLDFPGFNDKELDKPLFKWLTNQYYGFDFIFYIFDCQECLRKEASEKLFKHLLKQMTPALLDEKTPITLVILFNKFDLIGIDDDGRRFVTKQQKYIEKILNDHKIPKERFMFFNISANNLLSDRIIQTQDFKFIEQHPELMDAIYKYCQRFFSHDQIQAIKKIASIRKRLKIIKQQLTRNENNIKDILFQLNGSDSSEDTDNEGSKNNNDGSGETTDEEDSKCDSSNDETIEFSDFLQSLRSKKSKYIKHKVESHLLTLNMNQGLKSLEEFFICINCQLGSKWSVSSTIVAKLNEMIDCSNEFDSKTKYDCAKCFIESFECLKPLIPKCNIDFDFNGFLSKLISKSWLTHELLTQLMEQHWDGERKNSYYFDIIDYYCDYCSLHCNKIMNLDEFIEDIETYFGKDIIQMQKKLCNMLIHYQNAFYSKINAYNSCRAVDLLSFYAIDAKLLQQYGLITFENWVEISAILVDKQDTSFHNLVQTFHQSLKTQNEKK